MLRTLLVAMCLSALPAFAGTQHPIDTTMCAIAARPSRFHNKTVRIRATALSGFEASLLIDNTDGKWNKKCGRIWLEFESVGSDESTRRFLQLFGEQQSETETKCNKEAELKQGMAHILDPNVPAPAPCLEFKIACFDCPRYSIVATFTGKLRYSEKMPGRLGFGHLNAYNLQLDFESVSNLTVTDTLAASDADRQR